MPLEPGTSLGSYEILSLLGAGGMGEVYRARDATLDREVAIKVLPDELAQDDERSTRFEREAKALAALNHTNVATLFGFESAEDTSYLVMELVEGEDLSQRLARGPLEPDEAVPLFVQIAEGLEAAHLKGIIHRDLKPANLKITPDGVVKILDFGLARAAEGESESSALSDSPTLTLAATQKGQILGTAAYMAPEQAKGRQVDKRVDVWAFGACLYEALSGQRAFPGDSAPETLGKVLEREPDWSHLPRDTPRHLRELIERCLRKEPRLRQRDIGDVWLDLTREIGPPATQTASGDRSLLLPALGLSLLTLLLGFVGGRIASGSLDESRSSSGETTDQKRFVLPLAATPALDLSGDASFIALSPDARHVVVVAIGRDGVNSLFWREQDSLDFVELEGTRDAISPFFSPDSQWLAFFTFAGELKKIELPGGRAVTLLEDIRNSEWAFGSWGDDDVIVTGVFTGGLSRVAADGTGFTQLTAPERGWHSRPERLPDSDYFLFQAQTEPEGLRIMARSLSGDSTFVVVEEAGEPHFIAPGYLAFRRRGTVLIAPFDPVEAKITGAAVPLDLPIHIESQEYPDGVAQVDFSQTGDLVFLPELDAERAARVVEWAAMDGSRTPVGRTRSWRNHAISPDGQTIARTFWEGGEAVLELIDYDNDVPTPVARVPAHMHTNPLWSLDGQHLYFGGTSYATGILYRVAIGSSDSPEVVHEAPSSWGASPWSINGEGVIAFSTYQRDSGNDIQFFSTVDDEEIPSRFSSDAHEGQPSFSPDGQWLAYRSNVSGDHRIYVARYPSGDDKTPISIERANGPMWSRDGSSLFFGVDSFPSQFVKVDLELGSPVRVVDRDIVLSGAHDWTTDTVRGWYLDPVEERLLVLRRPVSDLYENTEPIYVQNWMARLP